MDKAVIGIIGLGTMGRNFLLNVADHGYRGAGFDLDPTKRELLIAGDARGKLRTAPSIDEFLALLESPKRVMILVPANVVDVVIDDLLIRLSTGDLVIDGGNSHFAETERRGERLRAAGIGFLGVGVSGGEEGARFGPSIMAGGDSATYRHVRGIFDDVSAKVENVSCAALVGSGSAGHFVKMVHNGIEYGLMQILAEVYDYLRHVSGLSAVEAANVFAEWNEGELDSFLVEITSKVLRKSDTETNRPLVEMILDAAAQKGTGKWTSQAAMDLGMPIPTIDSAVSMRQISSFKSLRERLARAFEQNAHSQALETETLRRATYAAFIATYAQGLSMLGAASSEKDYGLDLSVISKIWRGGCIIRSRLLEEFRRVFADYPNLENILLDDGFAKLMPPLVAELRVSVAAFSASGIPAMCLAASLNYVAALTKPKLPANLIQAQRDFFGAHTYRRIDREGVCHTPDWDEN